MTADASRRVDDVEEPLRELGILPLLFVGVGVALDIERGEREQQPRLDVGAGTLG